MAAWGMVRSFFKAPTMRSRHGPLFLIANLVTTSKAPLTTSVALVTTSFLLLLAWHFHGFRETDIEMAWGHS